MISDPPGPISNKLSSFVWKYPLPVASCDKWKQISEVVRSTTPSCQSKNATRGDEIATSRSLPRYARLKKRSGALAMCSGAFQNLVSVRTSSRTWMAGKPSLPMAASTSSLSPKTHTCFVTPAPRLASSAAVVTKVALAELLFARRRESKGTEGRRDD